MTDLDEICLHLFGVDFPVLRTKTVNAQSLQMSNFTDAIAVKPGVLDIILPDMNESYNCAQHAPENAL